MVKGLDRTLQSNIVTGRVPRLEQSAADMIRYWAQQVAHSFRVNVLGQLRGTSAPTPAGVTPGARTQAPPQPETSHLPLLRCAETGRLHPTFPIERSHQVLGQLKAVRGAYFPAYAGGQGMLQKHPDYWIDAFVMNGYTYPEPNVERVTSLLPPALRESSLLNASLDDNIRKDLIIDGQVPYYTARAAKLGITKEERACAEHLRDMGLGQALPSQGRVVQGFPNTLVDKRTGFVAGIYLKNGSEVVIQFAGLGSQHHGIGQFMRCAFQSLGLWVPKNFAQASKVTQMVQEHLRELNKFRPAGQQYTLALGGHSMGGAMATYAALRNGVPALVTNPLHLGLASRARIGAEAMRRGPELVTEVVVQTDWVSDNRASKLLALTDPMSIALTGDVAHNRGAIGQRYLIPRPTTAEIEAVLREDGMTPEQAIRAAQRFDAHNDIEEALMVLEKKSQGQSHPPSR